MQIRISTKGTGIPLLGRRGVVRRVMQATVKTTGFAVVSKNEIILEDKKFVPADVSMICSLGLNAEVVPDTKRVRMASRIMVRPGKTGLLLWGADSVAEHVVSALPKRLMTLWENGVVIIQGYDDNMDVDDAERIGAHGFEPEFFQGGQISRAV